MTDTVIEAKEVKVANTVEIVGENLLINAKGTFLPTVKIPLDHVLGAQADPEIERKLRRAWAFGRGLYCLNGVAEPGVRFYNPRFGNREKTIVILLKDYVCERYVVEVQDPEAVVAMINQAV
ncbi:MAG: hypothetical protein H0T57_05810 [Rubrobacter sp.]|nr:hypothetical protein [Rubrobacter sp.]